MKKRIIAMGVAGAMTLGALAGCGTSGNETAANTGNSDTAAAQNSKSYSIDVILKTTAAEFWQYVEAGAEQAGEDLGVKVDVKGASSETAYDEQQNMLETDLANNSYDGYVIAPLQSDLVANIISGETRPVVALDTDVDAPEVISFVGTGNKEAAKVGAQAAVKAAKEAGWEEIKCIDIAGVQGDNTNTARLEGFEEGIEESGGEFLSDEVQYADAVADKAVNAMEAIIQTHPEGIAIICAHSDDMIMSAARVAKGNKAYENTIFLGFNGDRSACEAILAGKETMSVIQDAYGMGYKAVETAVASLNGESVDEFVDSGSGVVDQSNAQERLDLLKTYLE